MVRILVECGSVVVCQCVTIYGEMNRYEVKDYADVVLVALVYEFHQSKRRAVTGGGTEKSGILVSPGFVAGVFAEGHNFHVVVSVFFQIWNQDFGHLRVGIPVVCLCRRLSEGAEMDLIDVQRFVFTDRTLLHPGNILKRIGSKVAYDGSRVWTEFHSETIGIAVVDIGLVLFVNAVLVHHPGFCVSCITFPEITVVDFVHLPFLPAGKFSN